jgi:hypothetical protein
MSSSSSPPPTDTAMADAEASSIVRGTETWVAEMFLSPKGLPEDALGDSEKWDHIQAVLKSNPMSMSVFREAILKHVHDHTVSPPTEAEEAAMAGRQSCRRGGAGSVDRTSGGLTLPPNFCVRALVVSLIPPPLHNFTNAATPLQSHIAHVTLRFAAVKTTRGRKRSSPAWKFSTTLTRTRSQ